MGTNPPYQHKYNIFRKIIANKSKYLFEQLHIFIQHFQIIFPAALDKPVFVYYIRVGRGNKKIDILRETKMTGRAICKGRKPSFVYGGGHWMRMNGGGSAGDF